MTNLQIFSSSEFGTVRTLEDNNGAVLFTATDVAQALGYANPRKAVADHCRCVTKRYAPHPQAPDKTIEMSFIPESDLYRLAFSSKLPAAEKFTDWVTSEVLPSIRKTGCYGTPDLSELSPELRCLIRLEQQQKQQAQELVRLNQKLDQLQGTRALGEGGWRRESARIIARIAQARGGAQYGPNVYQAAYTLLEEREHCSLTDRLEALRSKQRQQGMSKTRAGRLTKMDAIAASPESVEHWLKILHEMEVRYCTAAPEKE